MRILHLSTRLILGGSQENTILSCEGQARLGHEVHLAYGPIYGPEGSLLERVQRFGTPADHGSGEPCHRITTHEVPDLIREVHPRRDARCLSQLKRLIRDVRPDIVHTHSAKAGILGRMAAWSPVASRLSPLGVVHTIHGPPFMPLEGSLVRRAKIALNNRLYTEAERLAARRCHVIVSVADAMTQQFLARGIGRPSQYVTVRSGMETGPFLHGALGEDRESMRAALGIAHGDFVIGTVARLAEHKGHDDLLDALGDDLKSHPHWRLLWVGDGWWRERLLARVRAMGLTDRVIVTGLVPPERVPAHMRAMDLLAHPSYREGLPRTVPQALLSGVCPVAYDADGTREACIPPGSGKTGLEEGTGLLAPVGDRAALRAAIVRLADHPAERQAMAARGRAWAAEAFSAEAMVRDLERVYARAIDIARTRTV